MEIRVFFFDYVIMLVGIVLIFLVGFDSGMMMGCLIFWYIFLMICWVKVLWLVEVLMRIVG